MEVDAAQANSSSWERYSDEEFDLLIAKESEVHKPKSILQKVVDGLLILAGLSITGFYVFNLYFQ